MPDEEILAFVRDRLQSVWAIDFLILLRADRSVSWTGERLMAELRASPMIVRVTAEKLLQAGLARADESGAWRYAPASEEVDRIAGRVVDIYLVRPDMLRNALYAKPIDKVQAFADAFRLSKD